MPISVQYNNIKNIVQLRLFICVQTQQLYTLLLADTLQLLRHIGYMQGQ